MHKLIGATILTSALVASSLAIADISTKVQKKFTGRILITEGPLPGPRSTDEATIATFEKAHQPVLKHASEDDGIAGWTIDYTAFLSRAPKVRQLSFDFYTADKDNLYVANKRLMGVDPTLKVLTGTLTINEDDGVNRGRTYVVKLTGQVGKRERVFAKTKLTLE